MQNRETKYYGFAGVCIQLTAPGFKSWEPLEKFRTEPQSVQISYDVTFQEEVPEPEGELIYKKSGYEIYLAEGRRIRLLRHDATQEPVMFDMAESGQEHRVFFSEKHPEAWGGPMVMKILDLPRQLILHDAIFLHTSFVVWEEKALLFCGPKQIGKSTQAALWQRVKGAGIVNGDRAVLRKIGGTWHACGSPYSGTSNLCENRKCPIKSIVILSQGKENQAEPANPREALVSLLKNCSYEVWDRKQVNQVIQLFEQIISEVEFVKLSCLPEESAVV